MFQRAFLGAVFLHLHLVHTYPPTVYYLKVQPPQKSTVKLSIDARPTGPLRVKFANSQPTVRKDGAYASRVASSKPFKRIDLEAPYLPVILHFQGHSSKRMPVKRIKKPPRVLHQKSVPIKSQPPECAQKVNLLKLHYRAAFAPPKKSRVGSRVKEQNICRAPTGRSNISPRSSGKRCAGLATPTRCPRPSQAKKDVARWACTPSIKVWHLIIDPLIQNNGQPR